MHLYSSRERQRKMFYDHIAFIVWWSLLGKVLDGFNRLFCGRIVIELAGSH